MIGSFSPRRILTSVSIWAVASLPAMRRAGSWGVTKYRMKTTVATNHMTTTPRKIRRTRNLATVTSYFSLVNMRL